MCRNHPFYLHPCAALGLCGIFACGVRSDVPRLESEASLQVQVRNDGPEDEPVEVHAALQGRPLRGWDEANGQASGLWPVQPGSQTLEIHAKTIRWELQPLQHVEHCVDQAVDMCTPHRTTTMHLERTSAPWECERVLRWQAAPGERHHVQLSTDPDGCTCRWYVERGEERRELGCEMPDN